MPEIINNIEIKYLMEFVVTMSIYKVHCGLTIQIILFFPHLYLHNHKYILLM